MKDTFREKKRLLGGNLTAVFSNTTCLSFLLVFFCFFLGLSLNPSPHPSPPLCKLANAEHLSFWMNDLWSWSHNNGPWGLPCKRIRRLDNPTPPWKKQNKRWNLTGVIYGCIYLQKTTTCFQILCFLQCNVFVWILTKQQYFWLHNIFPAHTAYWKDFVFLLSKTH